MLVLSAEILTLTFCACVTLIVTASLALPVLLVQVIPKVIVPVSVPVLKLPDVLLLPAHPLAPLVPVQEVALFEDQRTVVLPL